MKLVVLFLAFVALASACDYLGAQVLKVTPETAQQHTSLIALRDHFDFWKTPRKTGEAASILCKKQECPYLKRSLAKVGMTFEIEHEDAQSIIEQHLAWNNAALLKSRKEGRAMDWEAYHDYDEIMIWCDSLAVSYPTLVTVTDVGLSYEGRIMKLVKVSTGGAASAKPSIWVDGGIHAREWISPATATYVLNELLTNSSAYQSTLDKVDFYFMLVINPDGYAYSWIGPDERLWRKTRTPNEGSDCFGTDANRNWDFHWDESGAADRQCFDTYHGPVPFSEPSQQVVRDQMLAVLGDPVIYMSYHAYGQLFLYPWGYSDNVTADNVDDLRNLALASYEALYAVHNTPFVVEQSAMLYPAAGASDDYAMGVAGFEYSYTIELRDEGLFGFELPPRFIKPVGEEMWAGFQVFMEYVRDFRAV